MIDSRISWCFLLGFWMNLFSLPAAAITKMPSVSAPAAIRGLPQNGGACHRNDANSGLDVIRGDDQLELNCLITPVEMQEQLKAGRALAIDTRSASQRTASHPSGAIDLGPDELRSKKYLASRMLILIGDGKSQRELISACTKLRREGFRQTRVLQGGFPGWVLQGGMATGTDPVPPGAPTLSAVELWAESQFESNLVLLIRSASAFATELPGATTGIPDIRLETIKREVDRWRSANKRSFLSSVILVGDAEDKVELERLRKGLQPIGLLIHGGTVDDFKRQMHVQNAT